MPVYNSIAPTLS